MHSSEIRKRFLTFFEKRGHAVIPSSSLVPEGDSSTLFTTAGMQPLAPYLLGQKHPKGARLVDIQKCVRTGDIDEVGDNRHLTFFEMMGNWSLNDYFKDNAISWSYELLTSMDEGFGLDPKRLYVTCFAGDENAPKDEESARIWQSVGIPENRIYYLGANDNWWSPGDNGPCGPDTEMFYDLTGTLGDLSHDEFVAASERGDVVEIWNDVFMEYEKKDGKVVEKLEQQNVDTGAGLERLATVLQKKDTVFETDLFVPILSTLPKGDEKARRIVTDHMRAAVFMITDGVEPSNTDRGYVVRRLIRRAVRYADVLEAPEGTLSKIVKVITKEYGEVYSNILQNDKMIENVVTGEEEKFRKTLEKGLKEIEKIQGDISGKQAFDLYQTYGFPVGMTGDIVRERGNTVDMLEFAKELTAHQESSRTASAGKFKGGLGDHSEKTVKLHTAHHLLLAALQKVLGKDIKQRGSNITPERLRMDFSFDRKLTSEEKEQVENQVNEWIDAGIAVVRREMPREEAERLGAEMEFGQKYPDTVSVYFVEDANGNAISKEFCGGPHVENTQGLGHFTILKEEASSAGVRRIKAKLD